MQQRSGGTVLSSDSMQGWGPYFSANLSGAPVTPASALSITSYWAVVKNISEDWAKLPLNFFREEGTSHTMANDLPAARLLRQQPNGFTNTFNFKNTIMAIAIARGNGYAYIRRNTYFEPTELILLSPDNVTQMIRPDGSIYYIVARNYYYPGYVPPIVEQYDMFHLMGLSMNGHLGLSILTYWAATLGISIAQDGHTASGFRNGMSPGLSIETDMVIENSDRETLKKSFASKYQGFVNNGEPLWLDGGWKAKALSLSPADQQLIESRKFSVEEFSRLSRMPMHKLSSLEHATFTNIEQQNLDYVQDCLSSWGGRMEAEVMDKLIPTDQQQHIKVKTDYRPLLQGDQQATGEYLSKMINAGIYSPNDARRLMGENPRTGGDVYLEPLNTIPSDIHAEYYTKLTPTSIKN